MSTAHGSHLRALHIINRSARRLIPAPSVKRILDVAILVAVVAQAISLTDFLLLPSQKKRVESWCEDVTLRLEFLNTAGFLQRWLLASRRARIGEWIFKVITATAIWGPTIYVGYIEFSDGFQWKDVGLVILTNISQGIWWLLTLASFSTIGSGVFNYLDTQQTVTKFVLAYVAMAGGLLCFIVGAGALIYWQRHLIEAGGFLGFAIAGNLYIALIVTWLVIFLDGVVTLVIAASIWPLRLLIVAARWFMWRVSSYPKGPLAALIACTGVGLAIVRVLLEK